MKLKTLQITGFRNIRKIRLDLDEKSDICALTGPNGHGKTNILEAIFLLAISKSFRTNENMDMIGFDDDFCSLSASFVKDGEDISHELIITKNPPKKTLKINGVIKKASDFIGDLNVVFFSPDDIGMIHLSPNTRRRYLDLLLSQLDRDYLEDSLNYQQAIKQRNSLLKLISDGKANEEELEFWDAKLAEHGLRIINKRKSIVGELNSRSSEIYKKVSGEKDELTIRYETSISAEDTAGYMEKLFAGRKRDIINGSSGLGPHRDDLIFLNNGHDMKSFASRGEWRSLVLTLKFTEIDLLKNKKGYYPILLLDDVFSELDDDRQKILFNMIKNSQTFITTTHKEFLDVVEGEKRILEVTDGSIKS